MSTLTPQHTSSAMNESPSLDVDKLFLELEQLKRKRDEASDMKEKTKKKMRSYEDIDEVVGRKDVMLPSSKSSHNLGRSESISNSPKQDNNPGDSNNGIASSSHTSHALGRSELPFSNSPHRVSSSDAKSTDTPQLTSLNPLGEISASSSSHTIDRSERSFSEAASADHYDEHADTDADASCKLEAESDLFTCAYRQRRTPTRARSISSHLSPRSLPNTMVVPTTSVFSNTDDNAELEWDAFKQSYVLENLRGSVCSFKSMPKPELKINHDHEATMTKAEEDMDSTDDEKEGVANEDDAIELNSQRMVSEEDSEDPDDYALSHWDEVGGAQDSEEETSWKEHGMGTRGRARLMYGYSI
jgi:hypothetical protein